MRLPDRRRRRPGAVRRDTGHDDPGQDAGRRHRAERVRRQPRGDVRGGPARSGGAQWDIQRAPRAHPCGPGVPGPGHGPLVLSRAAGEGGDLLPGPPGCLRTRRAWTSVWSPAVPGSACCSGSRTIRSRTATCSGTTRRPRPASTALPSRRASTSTPRGITASVPCTPTPTCRGRWRASSGPRGAWRPPAPTATE